MSPITSIAQTVWKSHRVDSIMIGIAMILTIISTSLFFKESNAQAPETVSLSNTPSESDTSNHQEKESYISVDISGAILKPDVYEVSEGSRLKEIIVTAGGLSYDADRYFVSRNFNMAKFVADQEKIYIPYTWDIYNGTFREEQRILEYLNPYYGAVSKGEKTNDESPLSVSINNATEAELDMLPGIGPTTVEKIIQSRPYITVEELITKKIVKQSVFDQILPLIQL